MTLFGRVLALSLVSACSDSPTMDTQPIGGACNGELVTEGNTSGEHVPMSTVISWANNPPTSGPHYEIWAAWDRQYTGLPRGNWVHNAEHGGIVLLYNCDGPCPDVVDALLTVARDMPADSMCSAPVTKRVIVSSDPLLPAGVQVAAVAWNHAYTASCADDYLATFAREHYAEAPENFCADGASLGGSLIAP